MKKLSLGSVTFLAAAVPAQGWTILSVGAGPSARNNHASAYNFVSQK